MTNAPIDTIGSHIGNGGQFDPTDPALRLAREIAADCLTRPEKWLPGVKAGIYEEIIAGKHDGEAIVQAALAGIRRASEMGDKHRFGGPPEPVSNPNAQWLDTYAHWYYQGND